ncbi:MAG: GNAT family N-acetyltransferase [Spirochaetota bacterium]
MTILEYSQITEAQYEDYIGEWEQSTERAIPAATQRKGHSFAELRSAWTEEESSAMYERRRVPATLHFFVDDTRRIVGAFHHRHELTESLALSGGHIGYGVRPSERGRGIASIMLESLL